jgi:hypothetical protein
MSADEHPKLQNIDSKQHLKEKSFNQTWLFPQTYSFNAPEPACPGKQQEHALPL